MAYQNVIKEQCVTGKRSLAHHKEQHKSGKHVSVKSYKLSVPAFEFKVILYSYLILKKMNERITDS